MRIPHCINGYEDWTPESLAVFWRDCHEYKHTKYDEYGFYKEEHKSLLEIVDEMIEYACMKPVKK